MSSCTGNCNQGRTCDCAAPSQEPNWKAEYLQCVDGHNLTLDELRDAAAQIAHQKRMKEICEQDNERLTAVVRGYEKQITKLQAENAEWKDSSLRWRKECEQLTAAAARMAYDVLGLIKLNTPPSKLVDECLVKLRAALGERHEHQ